jgi:hypothetical protein
MENQALSIMKPQLSRIENDPEVAAKLEQHIRETDGQIVRIEADPRRPRRRSLVPQGPRSSAATNFHKPEPTKFRI